MFVQKPDAHRSHMLTVATENVSERVFVESRATWFHLEAQDMAEICSKLQSLGKGLSSEEFMKLFNTDDLW